jgi:hypothetical protein
MIRHKGVSFVNGFKTRRIMMMQPFLQMKPGFITGYVNSQNMQTPSA